MEGSEIIHSFWLFRIRMESMLLLILRWHSILTASFLYVGRMEKNFLIPIGYWKGSGLSIVLDLIGGILTLGRTVTKVGQECESEYGLTQVFIAIRPEVLNQDPDKAQEILNETLKDIQASIPEKEGHTVRYPGQGTLIRRRENLKNGIPVNEEIWKKICEL